MSKWTGSGSGGNRAGRGIFCLKIDPCTLLNFVAIEKCMKMMNRGKQVHFPQNTKIKKPHLVSLTVMFMEKKA